MCVYLMSADPNLQTLEWLFYQLKLFCSITFYFNKRLNSLSSNLPTFNPVSSQMVTTNTHGAPQKSQTMLLLNRADAFLSTAKTSELAPSLRRSEAGFI